MTKAFIYAAFWISCCWIFFVCVLYKQNEVTEVSFEDQAFIFSLHNQPWLMEALYKAYCVPILSSDEYCKWKAENQRTHELYLLIGLTVKSQNMEQTPN